MDTTLIYRKTPEGESALSGRSRLPDQRLRAVLILVDGETTVDALCAKFDNKFQAEERIERLEQLGLIEAPLEASQQGRGAAESSAIEPAATELETFAAEGGAEAGLSGQPEPEPAQADVDVSFEEAAMAPPEEPSDAPSPQPAAAESEILEDVPELPPYPAESAETADEAPKLPEQELEVPIKEEGLYPEFSHYDTPEMAGTTPTRQSLLAKKLAAWRERRTNRPIRSPKVREAAPKVDRPADSPSPGRRSRRMPWLSGSALVLALAVGGLFFGIPWEKYRAEAEARATALVGQPVHIGGMGPALFPYPHVVLSKVSVGDEHLARAARVRLTPSFHSLGDGRRWAIDVVVEGATLEQQAAGAVCAATRLNSAAAREARLHSIRFADLALALPGTQIDGLAGEITVGANQDAPRVTLADSAGELHVELLPDAGGCRFTAESPRWTAPVGGGIALVGLSAHGAFDAKGGRLERFDARTADGVVGGSGTLVWAQGARFDLQVAMDHLRLEKALALVGRPAVARGDVDGKIHLTAAGASLQDLGRDLSGSGTVVVSRGAIDRFNVVEAARNPGKAAVYGGVFEFDRLSAELQFARGAASLHAVSATAGALQLGGDIAIDKNDRVKGSLQSQISSGVRNLRVPLTVGGSLVSPELGAQASRVAAAAVSAPAPDDATAVSQQ
ncbi:MAG: AsmA-like C-terminal region-containing protein [Rhodocyclaceae bacterium]